MRGGAALRSDSTDESIYQLIKDLQQELKSYQARTAALEAEVESHRAKLETQNHPPADLMAEAASLPINGVIVEKETYLNTGETTTLVSGDWCVHSVGKYYYYEGYGIYWEFKTAPSSRTDNCDKCPNGQAGYWAHVRSTHDQAGKEQVENWYWCN